MHTHTRLAWLRLNADALFLAGLAIVQGFDLFHPHAGDLAVRLGFVPPLFWVWSTLYVIGGLALLVGLLERHTGIELIGGRLVICIAAVLETFRIGTAYGFASHVATERYLVLALLLGLAVLRTSALLPAQRIEIVIPRRVKRR